MKASERESFFKSLALYFVTIEILIGFLLYHNYREDVGSLKQQLFLEMKNYNFNFEGEKFSLDFVPKQTEAPLLELREDARTLYALFPLPANQRYLLKIYYPKTDFKAQTGALLGRYLLFMLLLSAVVGAMAFGFARYTLRPLRSALALTDRFIKDIIHDLNTPVSAILINTSMLNREDKAVRRIEKSAKLIGMLYRNLQEYQGGLPQQRDTFRLDTLIAERLAFFRDLYPALTFHTALSATTLSANPDALTRIVDNLLSNACKYNVKEGEVALTLSGGTFSITNTAAAPIRSPRNLFDRFYKESERGIGIGLHIVKKLCDEERIAIAVTQAEKRVTFTCTLPSGQTER
ncbi:HAMP domain-containing histidine kinase [Sulfurimonas sp. HSL-3221]|uniref:sensor histidine kinase n=1 Tax=Thiomicrolovo sulfuroxydans TaxID=2894755 RepID=UPI001E5C7EF1|nr:HAMP domain-containing sensor histidine kinase [Sulfurimonas sp. HSL-3221]UFS62603.1 HAMP domain-containing histidine kinase [Sulfurimonas sp. HSL-3221]